MPDCSFHLVITFFPWNKIGLMFCVNVPVHQNILINLSWFDVNRNCSIDTNAGAELEALDLKP
jgi:hypothetical protein